MNTMKKAGCLALIIPMSAVIPAAFAQSTNAPGSMAAPTNPPADAAAASAAMMDLSKPGENHKILAQTVGDWTYTLKFWMSPDTNTPPAAYTGTTTTKALMDGRYFMSEDKCMMSMPGPDGKMQDLPFNGMEVAGYDNIKHKFVSNWIDNFGTGILLSTGDYDPATKAITYTGEEEPAPGMKITFRQVLTLTDSDHYKTEMYQTMGGHEMKVMEIISVRANH